MPIGPLSSPERSKLGVPTVSVCYPQEYSMNTVCSSRYSVYALYIRLFQGGHVISNQNPRWTQKPTYTRIFTHNIRSRLPCTPEKTQCSVYPVHTRFHIRGIRFKGCRDGSLRYSQDTKIHTPGTQTCTKYVYTRWRYGSIDICRK